MKVTYSGTAQFQLRLQGTEYTFNPGDIVTMNNFLENELQAEIDRLGVGASFSMVFDDAIHSHANLATLDLMSAAFTTTLKSTYDGYASGKENVGVAAAAVSAHDGNSGAHSSIMSAKLDAAKLVFIDTAASAGGAATESVVCTGLAAGDTVLAVSQKTAGASGTALVSWNPAVGAITLGWTADPGAGAIARVLVLKA